MTNKHSRLKALEKLATIAKVKNRAKSESAESDRLSKEVSELTDDELNAAYQLVQAQPIDPAIDSAIVNLTTQELINRYTQLCKGES